MRGTPPDVECSRPTQESVPAKGLGSGWRGAVARLCMQAGSGLGFCYVWACVWLPRCITLGPPCTVGRARTVGRSRDLGSWDKRLRSGASVPRSTVGAQEKLACASVLGGPIPKRGQRGGSAGGMPQLSPAPRALALRGWSLVPGGDSDVAHHVVTPDWQGTKAPLLSPSGWEEGWTRPAPPLPRLLRAPALGASSCHPLASSSHHLGLPGGPAPKGIAPDRVLRPGGRVWEGWGGGRAGNRCGRLGDLWTRAQSLV